MNNERLVWCDALRLIAFLLLLCSHAADPFYAAATYASSGQSIETGLLDWGVRWGSFARPCVPLFVMLTGVFSLPVRRPMEEFWKKRILRVLFPFLIWSVLYYLTPWFTGVAGMDKSVVYRLFSWAETDSQALSLCLERIAQVPYTFNFIACHMWYIYMLIGLYLYLPIFSAWVERAGKRQKELVLYIWAASLFLPYFHEYISRYAFGTCEWNPYGLFYYFSGFSGYLLLGHYIRHYVRWGIGKKLCICLPLIAIGFLITLQGYTYIMELPEKTPEQVEMFWTFNTPNVALMSIGWFLLLNGTSISSQSYTARLLKNLTTCGFGIYMIHYFFVRAGYDFGAWLHIPPALRIPASALVMLACAWTIAALLKRLIGKKSVYIIG